MFVDLMAEMGFDEDSEEKGENPSTRQGQNANEEEEEESCDDEEMNLSNNGQGEKLEMSEIDVELGDEKKEERDSRWNFQVL